MRPEVHRSIDQIQSEYEHPKDAGAFFAQLMSDRAIAKYKNDYKTWSLEHPHGVESEHKTLETALADWFERYSGIHVELLDYSTFPRYSGHTYDDQDPEAGVATSWIGPFSSFELRDIVIHEICHYLVATDHERAKGDWDLNNLEDPDLRELAAGICETLLHVQSGAPDGKTRTKLINTRRSLLQETLVHQDGTPISLDELHVPLDFSGKQELIGIIRKFGFGDDGQTW